MTQAEKIDTIIAALHALERALLAIAPGGTGDPSAHLDEAERHLTDLNGHDA
jgi:hypothetical protein